MKILSKFFLAQPQIKEAILTRFPAIHARYAEKQAQRDLAVEVSKYTIDIVDTRNARRLRIARNNHVLIEDFMNNFEHYFKSVEPVDIILNGELCALVDFSMPRYHDIVGFPDFPVFCPTMTEPFQTTQQYLDILGLKEGETILDLGGYCGLTAICFSKAVGLSGRVIVLEPDPVNFASAIKNIKHYQFIEGNENIALLPFAAAADTGKMVFSAEGTMGSSKISIIGNWRGRRVEVESISLIDLVERHELETVDVIKMDVEGSEVNLLAGSEIFFKTYRPRMVIEPHIVDGVLVTDKLLVILERYHYRCEVVEQVGSCLPLVIATPNHA